MSTATLIKDNLPSRAGHAALYRFDPPIQSYDIDGNPLETHEYAVCSAAANEWAHETYLFPADADGNVTDWSELPGSIKGTTSHTAAIEAAGYSVA